MEKTKAKKKISNTACNSAAGKGKKANNAIQWEKRTSKVNANVIASISYLWIIYEKHVEFVIQRPTTYKQLHLYLICYGCCLWRQFILFILIRLSASILVILGYIVNVWGLKAWEHIWPTKFEHVKLERKKN